MGCVELKVQKELNDLKDLLLEQAKLLVTLDKRVTDLEEWLDILTEESDDETDAGCKGCCGNCCGGCCNGCGDHCDTPEPDEDSEADEDDDPSTITMPLPCFMALIGTILECVLDDD